MWRLAGGASGRVGATLCASSEAWVCKDGDVAERFVGLAVQGDVAVSTCAALAVGSGTMF